MMSKQGTAGERKRVPLTVPQKLELIRRLERPQNVVMASYKTGASSFYDIKNRRTNDDCLWHQGKL